MGTIVIQKQVVPMKKKKVITVIEGIVSFYATHIFLNQYIIVIIYLFMYAYILEINQGIVIVKNILVVQGVAVVVENVLVDLVVIAVTKNDRVDHAAEVKGMCVSFTINCIFVKGLEH